jgi:para-aminobenzoate synthetase component 1
VKEYIAAGDVYQVNLSQRFEIQTTDEPYAIYERLRQFSPAPFGAYLDAGNFQILSSSPELLLRVDEHGRALTRPIKGTRPRGNTPAEDRRLAAELFASEKDQAELLMIVDLERNDLGRVCRYGSIQVQERHRIETHPTVFHLVATVVGQLRENTDVFDCLRSMLPGGSITGAPKIRAMQLIDELEPCRRHVYTGSLGYLGFDGTCDLNVAIRTILCRAGRASYHVGGGIVADSDSETEYQETLAKGRAMRAALMGEEKTS